MHDNRSNRIISEQNGVIRVNCMDGLGRSNTLLYKTAFKVLDIALK
jgi:protein-tyrosine phosphatase